MTLEEHTRWLGVVVVTAYAAASGCQTRTTAVGDLGERVSVWQPDSATTLAYESYSGFRRASRMLVSDSSTWSAVWERLYGSVQPTPPQPRVHFAAEAVVLAALGERSTSGFSIRIDSVVRFDGGAKVYVTAASPGPACLVMPVLTQPVHLVRAPWRGGLAAFEERLVARDCR